jgi:hypothetical protein
MDTTRNVPIACSLNRSELASRIEWIGELNRTALRSHARKGSRLVLTYAPSAAPRVRELATRESECCAFLSIDVKEGTGGVTMTVIAPDIGDSAARELLSPFLTGVEAEAESQHPLSGGTARLSV